MSGWRRREVAIPVPVPPTAVRIAAEVTGERKVGAARHWSEWLDDHRLLMLRSTIPVRTTDPEPAVVATARSVAYWADPQRLIMFRLNPDVSRAMAWSWDPTVKDLADHLRDAN